MALPGRLGGALANSTRHVQTAMSGLRRSDARLVKLGSISDGKHTHAALKRRSTPAIASDTKTQVRHSLSASANRAADDHSVERNRQRLPSVEKDDALTIPRQQPIPGARSVHTPADGKLSRAMARSEVISMAAAADRRIIETRLERPKVIAAAAGDGELRGSGRRSSDEPGAPRPVGGGKANFVAVSGKLAVEPGGPAGQAAQLKLTIGQRRPGVPAAGGQGNLGSAGPAHSPFMPVPSSQILGTSPKPRSSASIQSGGAAAPFAPVRRAVPRSSNDILSTPASNELHRDSTVNPTSRGTNTIYRAGIAEGVAVAARDSDATAAAGGGPTQGDVFLDGTLVGRWMARKMAQEAGRPPSGSSAFDPTRSPFPPGRMIGG
jgi:hypothetical protein